MRKSDGIRVVEIVLKDGILVPQQLPELLEKVTQALPAGGPEVVVLSGRLPIWAFGALVHTYHPRPAIATYDPRLQGGVVVASHSPGWRVGDVIPDEGEEVTPLPVPVKVKVEF